MKTLKIVGDSILKGVVYSPTGRRYSVCREHRAEDISNQELCVKNLSKMGATVKDGLKTLDFDKSTGMDENTTVIFEFAGNDCNFDWQKISDDPDGDHHPYIVITEFLEYLKKGIDYVKSYGARAAIAITPPIITEKYFSFITQGKNSDNILKWLKNKDALYRRQESYTLNAAMLAKKEGVQILDLRTPFLVNLSLDSYLCEDGIHPNSRGHEIIKQQLKEFVKTI